MIEYEPTYYHTIQVQDGDQLIDLVIYVWEPKGKPKGLLYFAHGLNGHAGNMSQFMREATIMSEFLAFGVDYRGFGRSGGAERGLIMDGLVLVEDTERVINWARDKYGDNLKVFLMGLSMGGAISLKVANRGQIGNIGGVIFVSPALRFNKFNPLPLSFIHYFKLIFMPRSYLFEPSYTSGCRHKKFIEKIKADKYIYNGSVRAGTIRCMGLWLRNVWDEVLKFKHPYLFIQSGVDKSIDPF
jgi:alpha-beta hydrolase superfamily lysophospholipase